MFSKHKLNLELTFGNLESDQEENLIQDFLMFRYVTKINYPQVMLKVWLKCDFLKYNKLELGRDQWFV